MKTKKLKAQGSSATPSVVASIDNDRGSDQGSSLVDFVRHFGKVFGSQRADRQTKGLMWRTLANVQPTNLPSEKKENKVVKDFDRSISIDCHISRLQ